MAVKQDQEAFSVLYHRYVHLSLGMCLKFLNNEEAKDAVQNIFLTIWTNCHLYKIQNFKPWLLKVTKNHCLQILRKNGNSKQFEELKEDEDVEFEQNVHLKLNEEQLLTYLNLCLKSLNNEQQTCIHQFYIHQKSYEETSKITGFSFKEVKSFIQNGRRNLKLCLQSKMDNH